MNRLLLRLGSLGAGAAAAGLLLATPAQATPSVMVPAAVKRSVSASQLALTDDYVLDFGRYHVPGDTSVSCSWRGCKVTNYYYYVELHAPGDMQQEVWDRTSNFIRCVVNNAGLALIVSGIATGGTSVPAFVAAFSAASSLCGSVTLSEMSEAYVQVNHDT